MSEIDVITNIDKNIIKSASDLLKDLYKQLQQLKAENEDIITLPYIGLVIKERR